MKIEYQLTDEAMSNQELLSEIKKIERFNFIKKIAVLPSSIKYLKNKIDSNTKLSAVIDFPLGTSSTAIRLEIIKQAVSDGASSIEIMMQSFHINNRQNAKIKKDIEECYSLCSDAGVALHYMMEYRLYNYSCLSRLTKFLLSANLNDIYLSSGYRLDNIYDHIIAIAMILKENPDANLVCNANIFNNEHLDILNIAKINHFRVNSINAVELVNKKYYF